MLPKLFQKTRIPISLSTSFYEASIILKAKQDKIAQENNRPKSLVNTDTKLLNKNTSKHTKITTYHDQMGLIL